jgi:hypothetical protein
MANPSSDLTLEERLQFEELVSDLAARLINVPPNNVDREITYGLQRLIEFLEADRCSLSEFSGDTASLCVTHSYQRPGIEPTPGWIMSERIPWYTTRMRRGLPIIAHHLPEGFPEEAVSERQYIRTIGMKSHLALPLKIDTAILGVLHFATFHRYRD